MVPLRSILFVVVLQMDRESPGDSLVLMNTVDQLNWLTVTTKLIERKLVIGRPRTVDDQFSVEVRQACIDVVVPHAEVLDLDVGNTIQGHQFDLPPHHPIERNPTI